MSDPLDDLREAEFEARRQAGKMPYHGTSMDELGFTYCRDQAKVLGVGTIDIGPGDFLSVTDEQIDQTWGVTSLDLEPSTLILAADENYFECFAEPLLNSMGGAKHQVAALLFPYGHSKIYYHAIRFIKFYQCLRASPGPLWMMDVDALFNKPPEKLFEVLGDKDCAFRIRPGRVEPWNQISAGIMGARKSALPYFRAIAQYLTASKAKWFWGIDQLAMYLAYQHVDPKPSVAFLDDKVFNLDCTPDGVVWILGGGAKFEMLAGKMFDPDTPQGRYAEMFRRFQAPPRMERFAGEISAENPEHVLKGE